MNTQSLVSYFDRIVFSENPNPVSFIPVHLLLFPEDYFRTSFLSKHFFFFTKTQPFISHIMSGDSSDDLTDDLTSSFVEDGSVTSTKKQRDVKDNNETGKNSSKPKNGQFENLNMASEVSSSELTLETDDKSNDNNLLSKENQSKEQAAVENIDKPRTDVLDPGNLPSHPPSTAANISLPALLLYKRKFLESTRPRNQASLRSPPTAQSPLLSLVSMELPSLSPSPSAVSSSNDLPCLFLSRSLRNSSNAVLDGNDNTKAGHRVRSGASLNLHLKNSHPIFSERAIRVFFSWKYSILTQFILTIVSLIMIFFSYKSVYHLSPSLDVTTANAPTYFAYFVLFCSIGLFILTILSTCLRLWYRKAVGRKRSSKKQQPMLAMKSLQRNAINKAWVNIAASLLRQKHQQQSSAASPLTSRRSRLVSRLANRNVLALFSKVKKMIVGGQLSSGTPPVLSPAPSSGPTFPERSSEGEDILNGPKTAPSIDVNVRTSVDAPITMSTRESFLSLLFENASSRFISSLTIEDLHHIEPHLERRKAKVGEVILHQQPENETQTTNENCTENKEDDNEPSIYIVSKGTIALYTRIGSSPLVTPSTDIYLEPYGYFVANVETWSCFGEVEVVTGLPSRFTAIASTNVSYVRVRHSTFLRLSRLFPQGFVSFVRTTIGRSWNPSETVLRGILRIPPLSSDSIPSILPPSLYKARAEALERAKEKAKASSLATKDSSTLSIPLPSSTLCSLPGSAAMSTPTPSPLFEAELEDQEVNLEDRYDIQSLEPVFSNLFARLSSARLKLLKIETEKSNTTRDGEMDLTSGSSSFDIFNDKNSKDCALKITPEIVISAGAWFDQVLSETGAAKEIEIAKEIRDANARSESFSAPNTSESRIPRLPLERRVMMTLPIPANENSSTDDMNNNSKANVTSKTTTPSSSTSTVHILDLKGKGCVLPPPSYLISHAHATHSHSHKSMDKYHPVDAKTLLEAQKLSSPCDMVYVLVSGSLYATVKKKVILPGSVLFAREYFAGIPVLLDGIEALAREERDMEGKSSNTRMEMPGMTGVTSVALPRSRSQFCLASESVRFVLLRDIDLSSRDPSAAVIVIAHAVAHSILRSLKQLTSLGMRPSHHVPGDYVLRAGTPASTMGFVINGCVQVSSPVLSDELVTAPLPTNERDDGNNSDEDDDEDDEDDDEDNDSDSDNVNIKNDKYTAEMDANPVSAPSTRQLMSNRERSSEKAVSTGLDYSAYSGDAIGESVFFSFVSFVTSRAASASSFYSSSRFLPPSTTVKDTNNISKSQARKRKVITPPVHTSHAVTTRESCVVKLNYGGYLLLTQAHPQVASVFISILSDRVQQLKNAVRSAVDPTSEGANGGVTVISEEAFNLKQEKVSSGGDLAAVASTAMNLEQALRETNHPPGSVSLCSSPKALLSYNKLVLRAAKKIAKASQHTHTKEPATTNTLSSLTHQLLSNHTKRDANTKCTVVSLIPSDSSYAHKSLIRFGELLAAALTPFGPAVCISSLTVCRALGNDVLRTLDRYASQSRLSSWLAALEVTHSFIICIPDVDDTQSAFLGYSDESEANAFSISTRDHTKPTIWSFHCVAFAGSILLAQWVSKEEDERPVQKVSDELSGSGSENHALSYRLPPHVISPYEQSLLWEQNLALTLALSPTHRAMLALETKTGSRAGNSSNTSTPPSNLITPVQLVLLHDPRIEVPRHTQSYLTPTLRSALTRHHHLKLSFGPDGVTLDPSAASTLHEQGFTLHTDSHLGRLARHVAGRSVGAVLSGGGARGVSHLGALQALWERGIPVDYIAGTSQGACVGALYASCWGKAFTEIVDYYDPKVASTEGTSSLVKLVDYFTTPTSPTSPSPGSSSTQNTQNFTASPKSSLSNTATITRSAPMLLFESKVSRMCEALGSILGLIADSTFPVLSYFEGKLFNENLIRVIGTDVEVEDLWIPFFCISTNVSRAQLFVHQKGVAWWNVRCSMSILEYLPPMNSANRVRTVVRKEEPVEENNNNMPSFTSTSTTTSAMSSTTSSTDQRLSLSPHVLDRDSFVYENDQDRGLYKSGDILIDGGYVNNLPVDIMKKLHNPHTIVAVDVENKEEGHLQNIQFWGDHLNGFLLLWKKIKSFWSIRNHAKPFHIPKYSEIIDSLVYINHNGSVRNLIQGRLIQLYVRPRNIQKFKILDYDKADQISQTGYDSTVEICEIVGMKKIFSPNVVPQP